MIIKVIWVLRAIVYMLVFKKISFPSYLGKPVFIMGARKVILGRRVRILPGLRMEVHGKNSLINIGDNVSIGQNFHIISGGILNIGGNTTISGNVLVTNLDHGYQAINVHIMEQGIIYKETKIGENCFIGFGAAIQAGTTLGKQCIVGANAVVRGNFPDYSVIVGAPARIVKRYNEETQQWQKTNKNGEFIND